MYGDPTEGSSDTGKSEFPFGQVVSLAYGPGSFQFGELSLPSQPGPFPLVILIHGGFWRSPYDLSLMRGLAEDLARRGIAAWNIEYRRVGNPGGGWPETLRDVARAADYLQTIAPRYDLDLRRVVTVGHSAGGHLALWLAARKKLAPGSPLTIAGTPLSLTGVVSLAGANDLEQVGQLRLGHDAAAELLGGSFKEVPERYTEASPAAHLPLGLPQVLIHGTADNLVPLVVSQAYARKATDAGDPVTLLELPGADHFVVIDPTSSAWQNTLEAIRRLLALSS